MQLNLNYIFLEYRSGWDFGNGFKPIICVNFRNAPVCVSFGLISNLRFGAKSFPSVMMTFRMGGARFWARTRAGAWAWAWAWAGSARLRIRLLPHAPVLLDQAPGVVPWNQDSYMALTWSKEVAVNLEPIGEVERVDGGRSLSGIAADEQKLVIWHLEQHVVVHRTRKPETRIDHLKRKSWSVKQHWDHGHGTVGAIVLGFNLDKYSDQIYILLLGCP